jgi:hypothetical protein
MALEFRLDPFQTRAFQECRPGKIATYPWGRGSGKTFFGRALIHTSALERDGIHVGLLMPSLKQARQVFWPGLLADFEGPLRGHIRGRANKTLLEVTYGNGSRLTTWGAENAGSIRGQRFDALISDETDDIDPEVEQAIVRPTFSRSGESALWCKFGTPRRGRAGSLFASFRKALRREGNYVGFSLKSSESPQVDQAWLKTVEGDTPPDIYEREYNVNFDAAGGRVYGAVFEEGFHIRLPPQGVAWSEVIIGCDHGWEHPGCLLLIGVIGYGRDAVAWVIEEVYERHRTEAWWKDQLRTWLGWYPGAKFYGDPSMPSRVEAYRRDCSARVQEVDNSIEDGVAAVADRLLVRSRFDEDGSVVERYTKLYISPRCVNLLTEMGVTAAEYDGKRALDGVGPYMRKRDPDNEQRYLDVIVDKHNDGSDALRYAIFNRFGGPDRRRGGVPHEALG